MRMAHWENCNGRSTVAQAKEHVDAIVAVWDSPGTPVSIHALAATVGEVLAAVCDSDTARKQLQPEMLALVACLATCGDEK